MNRRRFESFIALVLSGLVLYAIIPAQMFAADKLVERTLPMRRALHNDPTLQSSFSRLLSEYRKAGKVDRLVKVYQTHLASYPKDWSARTVLIRLLEATNDPTAATVAAQASRDHPKNAYIQYLHYTFLKAKGEAGQVEQLGKAIELEGRYAFRYKWIDELLPLAVTQNKSKIVDKYLNELAKVAANSPGQLLTVGRKMQQYGRHKQALEVLNKAAANKPKPQLMVEIELTAAEAEAQLGRTAEAAKRLDVLLTKVTADYWRRSEIMRKRLRLVRSEAEQKRMLAAAKARLEKSNYAEADVLNLASLLAGFNRQREALTLLTEAQTRQPKSAKIEQQILNLYGNLKDERGKAKFIAARLKARPDRADLRNEYVRTLFLVGREREAEAQFKTLIKKLSDEQKAEKYLALARHLRQASLMRNAASLFVEAGKLLPARLDVRREAAEAYLAIGQLSRAKSLLDQPVPEKAKNENILDVIQFMIQNEFYDSAYRILAAKLKTDKTNLDIRLLQATVLTKLGTPEDAIVLIDDARELADTIARYRRWLESAAQLHAELETLDRFFGEESSELTKGKPKLTEAFLKRCVNFAEVAKQQGEPHPAVGLLKGLIAARPEKKQVILLRNAIVHLFKDERGQEKTVQLELERLIEEDPGNANEYNARLAVLHNENKNTGQADQIITRVKVESINDAVLLADLRPIFTRRGDQATSLKVLQRLTVLAPTNVDNWQDYIAALAWKGSEPGLRVTLRRLLAGIDRMPLTRGTNISLQAHLFASHWRSIAARLTEQSPIALAEALSMLDELKTASMYPNDAMWVTWTRAMIFRQLDRPEALKSATADFDQAVKRAAAAAAAIAARMKKSEAIESIDLPIDQRIDFPDGLTLSVRFARRLLVETVASAEFIPKPALPKLKAPLDARWAFETPGRVHISHAIPTSDGLIYVFDIGGTLYCIDQATGKLVWQRSGSLGVASVTQSVAPVATPVLDGTRFYLPRSGAVECITLKSDQNGKPVGKDGTPMANRMIWRYSFYARSAAPAGISQAFTSIIKFNNKLLLYDPATQELACLDPASGLLQWRRFFEHNTAAAAFPYAAGATLHGDQLLIYGSNSYLVDANTGEINWKLSASHLPTFPITLETPDEDDVDELVSSDPYGLGFSPPPANPFSTGGSGFIHSHGGSPHSIMIGSGPSPVFSGRRSSVHWGSGSGISHIHRPHVVSRSRKQPPMYINYLSTSEDRQAQITNITNQKRDFAFVSPVVRWAQHSSQFRIARNGKDRLILANYNGVTQITPHFPIFARQTTGQGSSTILLSDGDKYWMQHRMAIRYMDTEANVTQDYNLAPVVKIVNSTTPPNYVNLLGRGKDLYMIGPNGIALVELNYKVNPETSTGFPLKVAMHSPWPKALNITEHKYTPPRHIYTTPRGPYYNDGRTNSPIIPHVATIDRNTLYTTVVPYRLVALEHGEKGE